MGGFLCHLVACFAAANQLGLARIPDLAEIPNPLPGTEAPEFAPACTACMHDAFANLADWQ